MRSAKLTGVLVLILAASPVTAYHLSAGTSDNVGVVPVESIGAPSVAASSSLYRIGTGADACQRFDPSGDGLQSGPIVADAGAIVTSHPFCKRLVYNYGSQQEVVSPVDQHYPLNGPGETWRFDAVFTTYVGSYGTTVTFGNDGTYIIINNVGRTLGLWPDNHNTICAQETPPGANTCGQQEYAVNLAVPNAALAAQDALRSAAGASMAQGNGWYFPAYDQTILGYLFLNGQPVDKATLAAKVAAYKTAGKLPQDAVPGICGFEPEPGVNTQSGVSDLVGWCEVAFRWLGGEPVTNAQPGSPQTWDYQSPCTSRAYLCGTAGGGAWYATEVCSVVQSDDCAYDDLGETSNGYDSTIDYDTWHFVVAPSYSPCNGLADPGFLTAPSGLAQPYIAHDLDVFAPLGSSAAGTGADNVDRFGDYYAQQVGRRLALGVAARTPVVAVGPVNDEAADHGDQFTNAPPGDDTAGAPLIRRANVLEPNAPGDNSRALTAARAAPHPCASIANGGLHRPSGVRLQETSLDPWVNYIDSRVVRGTYFTEGAGGGGVNRADGTTYDLYANTNAGQDASSRPVNGLYWTTGRVGIFADADDDFARVDAADEYEPVTESFDVNNKDDPGENRFAVEPFWIETIGAYPMFWEVYLNKNDLATLPLDAKEPHCRPQWSATPGTFLSDEMAAAGYDKMRTGLVQVHYAHGPVVALLGTNYLGNGIAPPVVYPGPVAVAFLSQSLHSQRLFGDAAQKAFVNGLVQQAAALAGAPSSVPIVYPRDSIGQLTNPSDPGFGSGVMWRLAQSDFFNTCGTETGWFRARWSLSHVCGGGAAAGIVCGGDKIVTGYTFQLTGPLGSATIPAPPIALPVGVQTTWWDVDRFDNT